MVPSVNLSSEAVTAIKAAGRIRGWEMDDDDVQAVATLAWSVASDPVEVLDCLVTVGAVSDRDPATVLADLERLGRSS